MPCRLVFDFHEMFAFVSLAIPVTYTEHSLVKCKYAGTANAVQQSINSTECLAVFKYPHNHTHECEDNQNNSLK